MRDTPKNKVLLNQLHDQKRLLIIGVPIPDTLQESERDRKEKEIFAKNIEQALRDSLEYNKYFHVVRPHKDIAAEYRVKFANLLYTQTDLTGQIWKSFTRNQDQLQDKRHTDSAELVLLIAFRSASNCTEKKIQNKTPNQWREIYPSMDLQIQLTMINLVSKKRETKSFSVARELIVSEKSTRNSCRFFDYQNIKTIVLREISQNISQRYKWHQFPLQIPLYSKIRTPSSSSLSNSQLRKAKEFLQQGIVLAKQGHWEPAKKEWQLSLQFAQMESAYWNLAMAHWQDLNWQLAKRSFQSCLAVQNAKQFRNRKQQRLWKLFLQQFEWMESKESANENASPLSIHPIHPIHPSGGFGSPSLVKSLAVTTSF